MSNQAPAETPRTPSETLEARVERVRHWLQTGQRIKTHWEGCEQEHTACAALDALSRLTERNRALERAVRQMINRSPMTREYAEEQYGALTDTEAPHAG